MQTTPPGVDDEGAAFLQSCLEKASNTSPSFSCSRKSIHSGLISDFKTSLHIHIYVRVSVFLSHPIEVLASKIEIHRVTVWPTYVSHPFHPMWFSQSHPPQITHTHKSARIKTPTLPLSSVLRPLSLSLSRLLTLVIGPHANLSIYCVARFISLGHLGFLVLSFFELSLHKCSSPLRGFSGTRSLSGDERPLERQRERDKEVPDKTRRLSQKQFRFSFFLVRVQKPRI